MKSTKEMARELGFLKKRAPRKQHLAAHTKSARVAGQTFSYVIVIDFESTCWKDQKNTSQEIIEFPAVLLNTSNGHLEAEFQHYVMPDENPMLSHFCQEFTGITQETVESGVPLFICLNKFSQWLKRIESEKQVAYNSSTDSAKKLCTFVTWSDWDLGVCLHYECQRKQLYKPSALNSWIDARAVYRNFYQRKPKGLSGALQEVGIEFAGRQHSGLDDAKNTARLVWRMIQDGCQLNITKTIKSGRPMAVPAPKGLNQHMPVNQQSRSGAELSTNTASSKVTTKVVTKPHQTSSECGTAKKRPVKRRSGSAGQSQVGGRMHSSGTIVASGTNGPKFRIYEDAANPCEMCGTGTSKCAHSCPVSDKIRSTLDDASPANCSDGTSLDSPKAGQIGQDVSESNSNVLQCRIPRLDTPDQKQKLQDGFKTPPACNTPFFNQNSITRYGKAGEKTQISTNRTTSPVDNHHSDGFKTPANPGTRRTSTGHDSNNLRTPSGTDPPSTCAKITPPLCKCGKRSKRRVTVRPGPNQGRAFFSCPGHRRSSSTSMKVSALKDTSNSRTGCGFFSWESAVLGGRGSPGDQTGLGKLGAARTPSPLSTASIQKAATVGVTPMGSAQKNASWMSGGATPIANIQRIANHTGQSSGTYSHGGVTPIGTWKGISWR